MVIKLPLIPIGLNYENDMTSLSGSTIVFAKGHQNPFKLQQKAKQNKNKQTVKTLSTCKLKSPKTPDFKS